MKPYIQRVIIFSIFLFVSALPGVSFSEQKPSEQNGKAYFEKSLGDCGSLLKFRKTDGKKEDGSYIMFFESEIEIFEHIYTQQFFVHGNKSKTKYDVVVCNQCGFVFSTNISSIKDFQAFYQQNLKYAYGVNKITISQSTQSTYEDYVFLFGAVLDSFYTAY